MNHLLFVCHSPKSILLAARFLAFALPRFVSLHISQSAIFPICPRLTTLTLSDRPHDSHFILVSPFILFYHMTTAQMRGVLSMEAPAYLCAVAEATPRQSGRMKNKSAQVGDMASA